MPSGGGTATDNELPKRIKAQTAFSLENAVFSRWLRQGFTPLVCQNFNLILIRQNFSDALPAELR